LGDYESHPDELECLSTRATEKRRTEFILGRLAAFRALQALGVIPQPVPKAKSREPLWQDGIVGAITHKAETACAVVARQDMTCGVGVDLESLHPPVRFSIATKVCTETEQAWLAEAPDEKDTRLKMIFSAKESGFKAFFPIEQIYLGYKDAELSWREEAQSFAGVLLKSAGDHHPIGFPFEVGCRIIEGFVLSFVRLPPIRL
jgi:4'-phosphopantetheinyl transferase EntD